MQRSSVAQPGAELQSPNSQAISRTSRQYSHSSSLLRASSDCFKYSKLTHKFDNGFNSCNLKYQ